MKRWIHASEEGCSFPEKIWIELYPETHNGHEYVKDYEHEDGGCYYRSPENDDPITGSFVSLYPDGRLTYLWNGQEKLLNREWHIVEDQVNACDVLTKVIKADSNVDDRFTYHFRIYELDEDGDEVDVVDGVDTLDEAIEVAKNQEFDTHIVFCPNVDPDDDPEIAEWYEYNSEYEPYEIVWENIKEDEQ